MCEHEENAAGGVSSGNNEEAQGNGGTWLAEMVAARHALFEDVTAARRDEDELPDERGASGANLRWHEALGDPVLDRHLRRAAWRLQKKHPNSDLDAEEVAQRMRLRLYNGAANFRVRNGLPPDAPLAFKKDRDWTQYAATIVRNECARHAGRMEREAKAARRLVSRDASAETDADGEDAHWREALDFRAAMETLARDERQIVIEAVIARMSGLSRRIVEAYYRDGLGQRTIAAGMGLALSSFQHGPWAQMKADFVAAM